MKRLLLLASLLAAIVVAPAGAAVRHDAFPLHPGTKTVKASAGPRVKDIQWLLAGHKPNVFTKIKPTYNNRKPNGFFGAYTTHAVLAYKYRLGYPKKGECGETKTFLIPTVQPYFFALLEGKQKRSICWVSLAAARVKQVVPGSTVAALDIKNLELLQLGVQEQPLGSNRGCRISYTCAGYGPYQGATGAFGLAWCASLQQWAYMHKAPGGRFANNSAYTPYIAQWGKDHNFLNAKPRVGALVIFLTHGGVLVDAFHMGYVVKVTASGYVTIEGNYADSVREVFHTIGDIPAVFIYIPGVA